VSRKLAALVMSALLFGVIAATAGSSTLPNGGFETGDFSGWTDNASGVGGAAWLINNGSTLPISDHPSMPVGAGNFDAAFDQDAPSSGYLYQDVVVPPDGRLDFAFAYRNYAAPDSGGGCGPDFSEPVWAMSEDPFNPEGPDANQWISVDVMDPSADPQSFDGGDIIATVFRSAPGTPASSGWQNKSVALTPGDTVRLRFAAADTVCYLTLWVDSAGAGGGDGPPAEVRPPERVSYCSVPGNTLPDGTPIPVGTFLDLQRDQPKTDTHYKDAGVANFVMGLGLTCDQIPIGFTHQGFAGHLQNVPEDTYPLYAPPAPLTTPSSFRAGYGF
jgi:hypothetical protein